MLGIWNHPDSARLAYFGLHALQHRGQDGAGIASYGTNQLQFHRGVGLLSHVFQDERHFEALQGKAAIGTVHYKVAGTDQESDNIGPLVFRFLDNEIAITHSGNVTNRHSLRKLLEAEGAVFASTSEAELLVHLLRRSRKENFEEKLQEALHQLRGGFNFIILTKDALYGIVDPHCFRPLSYGRISESETVVIASETCAIDGMGACFESNIHAGTYVVVNEEGIKNVRYETKTQIAIEAMEYVYFARPDSEFAGRTIHTVRKELGRILAEEAPCPAADMVIGVPNSSLSAATGYAEESGLPYEMGLVKNQYVGRTFIEPTKALREQGVQKKISAVRGVVKDKSIVLVDDSIVRGTTSKRLIKMLRDAGAKEIHLRITSPPIRFPNYYGVDMSTTSELIAAYRTIQELCEDLHCDSLGFLSIDGLLEAIGTHFDAPYNGLALSIFNGDYPESLGDYEAIFQENLTPIQKQVLRGEQLCQICTLHPESTSKVAIKQSNE